MVVTKKKSSTKKKDAPKKTGAKKAFGGYSICFKGCKETAEEIFGSKDLAPSEMTKAIWAYVKNKKIAGKK